MSDSPVGYQIDRAEAHELADLPAIEAAAGELFPPEDLAPGLRAPGLPLSFFERAASDGRLWVARTIEAPMPVGFALVTQLDGSPHLHEMDVLPAHGRRGIGRALVLHVVRWARASGHARLTLTTFRHLPWNAPFYASIGFVEIDERDCGPDLRVVLAEEQRRGLDPRKRTAMSFDLRAE